MPFGVTQWGYSPDPRPPSFCTQGWNFGQIPPWRWFMKTTGAESPYEALNTGVLWTLNESIGFGLGFAYYKPVVPIPGVDDPDLHVFTTDFAGFGQTVAWFCSFFLPPHPDEAVGTIAEFFPIAIAERSFAMVTGGTGGGLIPNPLVISPRKWNFEL